MVVEFEEPVVVEGREVWGREAIAAKADALAEK